MLRATENETLNFIKSTELEENSIYSFTPRGAGSFTPAEDMKLSTLGARGFSCAVSSFS